MQRSLEPTPLKLCCFALKKTFGCVLEPFLMRWGEKKSPHQVFSWQDPAKSETRTLFDFFETKFENENLELFSSKKSKTWHESYDWSFFEDCLSIWHQNETSGIVLRRFSFGKWILWNLKLNLSDKNKQLSLSFSVDKPLNTSTPPNGFSMGWEGYPIDFLSRWGLQTTHNAYSTN